MWRRTKSRQKGVKPLDPTVPEAGNILGPITQTSKSPFLLEALCVGFGVSGNPQSLTVILFEERHILDSGICGWGMEQQQKGVLRF